LGVVTVMNGVEVLCGEEVEEWRRSEIVARIVIRRSSDFRGKG
jgi:hypothetical protein